MSLVSPCPRCVDPSKFNGIVLVERVNVTSGYNLDLHWQVSRDDLTREGAARSHMPVPDSKVQQLYVLRDDAKEIIQAAADSTIGTQYPSPTP